jgi:hypothetical protein
VCKELHGGKNAAFGGKICRPKTREPFPTGLNRDAPSPTSRFEHKPADRPCFDFVCDAVEEWLHREIEQIPFDPTMLRALPLMKTEEPFSRDQPEFPLPPIRDHRSPTS